MTELLYAREDIEVPGGDLTTSVCVIDVSPYWEIRGFFAQRSGPITLTLRILAPNNPGAEPSSSNGYVIGQLDQFALQGDITRTYTMPGIWLEVLATTGSGGGKRIGQLTFVGRT
ncbi:MAG: hypothetical protein WAK12_01935 [Acidimicrobiales bacterium]